MFPFYMISIHALREEGDDTRDFSGDGSRGFLSTPSARRATFQSHHLFYLFGYFYPRPPRGGRPPTLAHGRKIIHFYPRPPRGGRHIDEINDHIHKLFLSTPSARRATDISDDEKKQLEISIHALREEGDYRSSQTLANSLYFYPRPPRGGRRSCLT